MPDEIAGDTGAPPGRGRTGPTERDTPALADRPAQHLHRRRTRDRALVVVLVGIVLLMPPFAKVFEIEARVLGIPVTLVYLFTVWAGLIIVARHLAQRLGDSEPDDRTIGG